MQLDPAQTAAVALRLRRAQGQVGGAVRMLEEGADCGDVLTQLSAAAKAMDRAGLAILTAGLEQCLGRQDDGARADRERLERLFLSLA